MRNLSHHANGGAKLSRIFRVKDRLLIAAAGLVFTLSATSQELIFQKLSAGDSHTMGIKPDGTLWAWGDNYHCQLGTGVVGNRSSPTRIGVATNWASVAPGYMHTVGIRTDGTLWAWGENTYGQFGDGTYNMIWCEPLRIGIETNWQSAAAGVWHTVAIRKDGSLWAWGDNSYGQLGDGTTTPRHVPVRIGSETNWQSVSSTFFHVAAIKTDGTLWTWGDNFYGQLGIGVAGNRTSPTQVGSEANWQSVSVGDYFTVALKKNGTLWAWGRNNRGQLGIGSINNAGSPVQIGSANNWRSVSAGSASTLAIKTDDSLWAWGDNSYGQAGDGSTITSLRVSPFAVPLGGAWQSVVSGGRHVLATRTDGTLWAWGSNNGGQLGDGTAISVTPRKLGSPIILQQPASLTNVLASSSTFTVAPSGSQPFTFWWRRDGINLNNAGNVSGATTSSLTLTNLQFNDAGNYSVVVSNAYGSVTSAAAVLTVQYPEIHHVLSSALDNTNLVWFSNGTNNWFSQAIVTHDGLDAAQSGPVGQGKTSGFGTTITGPGFLSFWWRVSSSGAGNSYLRFYVDGVLQNLYMGYSTNQTWWAPSFYLGAGTHTLVWEFFNANAGTAGNAGWVDQVSFMPGGSAPEGEVYDARVPSWAGGWAKFEAWAQGTPPLVFELLRDGAVVVSGTNSSLTLSNIQPADANSAFSVRVTNDYGSMTITNLSIYLTPVAAWGDNSSLQCRSPEALSNVVQVGAGGYHSIALRSDGTVVAWGDDLFSQTAVPEGLDNVTAVAAGGGASLALRADGTLAAWGSYYDGTDWVPVDVPQGLSGVAAMAVGGYHFLTLLSNQTLTAWGWNNAGQTDVPEGLSTVIAVACGDMHSLAVRSDGTVIAWGDNGLGQCDVPLGLSTVTAVAGGFGHSLALRSDGTVVGWGTYDYYTNWLPVAVPNGLSNVIAIAAGGSQSLALRADGSLVGWGTAWNPAWTERVALAIPPGLNSVTAIAAGSEHSLALISSIPSIQQHPIERTIAVGGSATFSVRVVGASPLAYQWYFNTNTPLPNATNASLTLSNAQFSDDGLYSVAISNAFGGATSSFARLRVVPVPAFAVSQNGSGPPQVQLIGTEGTFCDIQKSTNLVNWILAGRAQAGAPLTLDELDPAWRVSPRGFFRLALAASQQELPPTIATQPLGTAALVGGTARFSVIANGSLPLSYQWQFNGTDIDGATSPDLDLSNLQNSDTGLYSVIVSCPGGVTQSVAAQLYVQSGDILSSDDFNDGVIDPARWGMVFFDIDPLPMLVETNGHLEFVGTGAAAQAWIGSLGSYTEDWELRVDACLTNVVPTEDGANIEMLMAVGNQDNTVFLEDTIRLSFNLSLETPTTSYRSIVASADANGEETGFNELVTSSTQATFRITFNAATKTLTAWVDEDGSANGVAWTELLTQRVDDLGANWGMNADSRFIIGLAAFAFAYESNPGDGLFFDNFVTSGGIVAPGLFKLADYYPLPLGTEWAYDGFDWSGIPAYAIRRVDATNTLLTLYTGRSPAVSYQTNCVSEYNAYLDPTTLAAYDEWVSYMAGGSRFGFFGESGAENLRLDGGAILPEYLALGSSTTNVVDAYVNGVFVGSVTLVVQLLGKASLTVPAGDFNDVLRMRMSVVTPGNVEVHDEWWAKGVGKIKEQAVSGDGSLESWELISYSPSAPSESP